MLYVKKKISKHEQRDAYEEALQFKAEHSTGEGGLGRGRRADA
jgi:hypothetical protein